MNKLTPVEEIAKETVSLMAWGSPSKAIEILKTDRTHTHDVLIEMLDGLEQEHHYNTSGINMDLIDRKKAQTLIKELFNDK